MDENKQHSEIMPLPIQPRLDHRGRSGLGSASLFPPAGTFEAIGGRAAVDRLVDGLYDRIENDTLLRPAFNRDLTRERVKLKAFFEAWFGGAPTYFNADWPPSIKAVHVPVSISHGMAMRWIEHFLDSFTDAVKDPALVYPIRPSITHLALSLVDRADEPTPGERIRDVSDSVLMQAIQHDDVPEIAKLASLSPNVLRMHGPRLLLVAIVRGKVSAAEEILRQGVSANAVAIPPGNDAKIYHLPMLPLTPLCGALVTRRDSFVNLLVGHGAQYDIFTATVVGDLEAVEKLLDLAPELADANDPASDIGQITPLMHAVYAGQFEIALRLLQRGATVGKNSVRLVRAAANLGHQALTNLLLEHGADPSAIGAGTWAMYPAIAETLLSHGVDVNQEPGAWIGLCCTGNSGHKENAALAQALLRCGADTAARYKGRSALHCAAKAGFVHVIKALIEHGSDVNAINEHGQTPLDEVENAGKSIDREPVRRILIEHGGERRKIP